ncbi:MAG: Gfo/Idh/MocA family oxidoreductase [Saprospiraceae bacterium]|nr:Gfo/Idh/MocA family oxidoreductase [Saprospiraceae bacterium]
MTNKKNRRDFLKTSTVAGAGFFLVPRHVLGGPGYTAPSDQLAIAAIGAGGKGNSDIRNAWNNGKNRVIALCDVDPKQAVTSVKRFPDAKFYSDFRELLDKEDGLDAVTISTPDHTHAVIAYNAMMKGLHVYVQKPITHTLAEARLLTETAASQRVVTQMGNQGGSNPGVQKVIDWVDKKRIGTITKVYIWTNRPVWPQGIGFPKADPASKPDDLAWDLWLGPASSRSFTPNLHPFNWRGFWDFGTGALGDMGCHLFDAPYKALKLGYPTGVQASVADMYSRMWSPDYVPEGCPVASRVSIDFPKDANNPEGVVIEWTDGGIMPVIPDEIADKFKPDWSGGAIMMGQKGIITVDTYGDNPKLYIGGQQADTLDTSQAGNLDLIHNQSWTEACKAGYGSKEHLALASSFDYAGPFTETVLMGNLAIRAYQVRNESRKYNGEVSYDYFGRKKLYWDGKSMKITNLPEINDFVTKKYREGFTLPV